MSGSGEGRVLALSGGVGGAKLALGLYRELAPERLTVVANTGDDFRHLGLHVAPDIDTLVYTLSGLANLETGWGRADDSGNFMAALAGLGGEDWFVLGDRDLAMHVERTRRLAAGEGLAAVTEAIARRLAIAAELRPMADAPVPTVVLTEAGELPFQHYFVRERCRPRVTGFRYQGAAEAEADPRFLERLADPDLRCLVICPSNPFISIDPILALPGVREAIAACPAPRIAVSPLIGGQAVKGPTAKMMTELGLELTPVSIVRHYAGLLDGLVLDESDLDHADPVIDEGVAVLATRTLMRDLADRERLAGRVLDFARQIVR